MGLLKEEADWSVVYKSAVKADGSPLFPQKLPLDELRRLRRELGPYIYANQYDNKIIPDDAKKFKKEWLKYYEFLPEVRRTTAFIDPAIGLDDQHDYTALTIVHTDPDLRWFVEVAKRTRITPTQLVNLCFEVYDLYKPATIGIEMQAYQESLKYMLDEEMKRRKKFIPIAPIKRAKTKSNEGRFKKYQRIEALIPRFEWGNILFNQGLVDLEDEYSFYPRATHDDLLDSLASHDEIIVYPETPKEDLSNIGPNHPKYEREYIRKLALRQNQEDE